MQDQTLIISQSIKKQKNILKKTVIYKRYWMYKKSYWMRWKHKDKVIIIFELVFTVFRKYLKLIA
jgi:hypothetical protein